MSKSVIFLVKSFMGNFYRHLAIIFWLHWLDATLVDKASYWLTFLFETFSKWRKKNFLEIPTPSLVAFIGVTSAHGPSSESTASRAWKRIARSISVPISRIWRPLPLLQLALYMTWTTSKRDSLTTQRFVSLSPSHLVLGLNPDEVEGAWKTQIKYLNVLAYCWFVVREAEKKIKVSCVAPICEKAPAGSSWDKQVSLLPSFFVYKERERASGPPKKTKKWNEKTTLKDVIEKPKSTGGGRRKRLQPELGKFRHCG